MEAQGSYNSRAVKQHIWGLTYIDELIETELLESYGFTESYHDSYFALLDSKYCVLG